MNRYLSSPSHKFYKQWLQEIYHIIAEKLQQSNQDKHLGSSTKITVIVQIFGTSRMIMLYNPCANIAVIPQGFQKRNL